MSGLAVAQATRSSLRSRFARSCRSHTRRRWASSTANVYDVVCIGGGPAGLSLVTALRANPATAHLKIALIESQNLARSRFTKVSPTEWSNRCSSLTPASVRLFQDIDSWKHVQHERVQPFEAMEVWDGLSESRIGFDWTSSALSTTSPSSAAGGVIAYMIENLNISNSLLQRLDELGGVTIHDNTKVSSIDLGEDTPSIDFSSWPMVSLSSGHTLVARLLIGADGANSPVRTFANIESRGWDYNRHGLVATLRLSSSSTSSSHDPHASRTAYQRFLPTGPIALLPLPGPYASLVWSTLPTHATHLKSLSPSDFIASVNAAFRLRPLDLEYMHTIPTGQQSEYDWRIQHTPQPRPASLPPLISGVQEGTIASFPLRLRHAASYNSARVALLGDAAHTIHPLAGQGLNQGQADVAALANVIAEAVSTGQDIGSPFALDAYTAARWGSNHALLGVVDKLHKLYAFRNPLVVGLRSAGLDAVDAMGWLKGQLMSRASGASWTGRGSGSAF